MKKYKGCLIAVVAGISILIGLFILAESTSKGLIEYSILENKQYDVPIKSQISLRVAPIDTTASEDQIKDLLHTLVKSSSNINMKYHPKPTNIYVYIYKTKASFEADPSSWIMMYAKSPSDDEGSYTYHPLDTY